MSSQHNTGEEVSQAQGMVVPLELDGRFSPISPYWMETLFSIGFFSMSTSYSVCHKVLPDGQIDGVFPLILG